MPTLHWIGKDKSINHHLDVPSFLKKYPEILQDFKQWNKSNLQIL